MNRKRPVLPPESMLWARGLENEIKSLVKRLDTLEGRAKSASAGSHFTATRRWVSSLFSDTGWVDLTLNAAYQSISGKTAQYRAVTVFGVTKVSCRGQVQVTASTSTGTSASNIATMPSEYAPSDMQRIFSIGLSGSAASARAWVEPVASSNTINCQASASATAWDLSGIHYAV